MTIKYVLDDGAFEPVRAHKIDAGFDLRMPKIYGELVVYPDSYVTIDTGVHFDIPEGYVGFLKSKSGLNVKSSIVSEGVIDAGYTGSVVVKLYNHGREYKSFLPGDKITQIVFLQIPDVDIEEVPFISTESERGNSGFGSSGR